MLTAFPKSSEAELAMGEALYRAGRIPDSADHLAHAVFLDPCNARVQYDLARIAALNALHGVAATRLEKAHQLSPSDPLILWAWLDTLPELARSQAINALLSAETPLDENLRKELKSVLDTQQAGEQQRCTIAPSSQLTPIAIEPVRHDAYQISTYALTVAFNGDRRRLELDTGASGITLTQEAARKLHLEVKDHEYTFGIGDHGSTPSSVAVVDSIRIGNIEFSHCVIQILDKKEVLDNTDGLIGGDVFSSYILTLDYPKGQLRLRPLPVPPQASSLSASLNTMGNDDLPQNRYIAPGMSHWTHIFRVDHQLLLQTNVNQTGERLFLADTGSGTNLLSNTMAREIHHASETDDVTMKGLSGKVDKVNEIGAFQLDFAGLHQPVASMLAIDLTTLSHSAGIEISGILGRATLTQLVMEIDYRDNLVNFTYIPVTKASFPRN